MKAGLVKHPEDWQWSSERRRKEQADGALGLPDAGGTPALPGAGQTSALPGIWHGAQGLAEDVRYYGKWMRDEAEKRIGHLYPKIEVTEEMSQERPDLKPYIGRKLTVIAWIWARTVKSPNPAFAQVHVPLASTFMLSTKPGKEAYVEPVIELGNAPPGNAGILPAASKAERRFPEAGETPALPGYRFTVKVGKPVDVEAAKNGTKLARANFLCLMSGEPISGDYIKAEGKAGRIDSRLMAIVAEGDRERVYFSPTQDHAEAAREAKPIWRPQGEIATRMTGGNCTPYGLKSWGDLFTPRQLVALTTFSDLVQEAHKLVTVAACSAALPEANNYANAVMVYLAFAVDYAANYWSVIATPADGFIRGTFARQAIPMTWDYAEAPPFGNTSGNWLGGIEWISKVLLLFPRNGCGTATAKQADATNQHLSFGKIISTDPPYYDNIGYADLSDFFYVWLRNTLRSIYPDLFTTLAVPKAEELVATPNRHGSKEKAEAFFLDGMTKAMQRVADQSHLAFPVTIYYAFKQSESDEATGIVSTGWDTFLEALIRAGFAISGTWPMRTERGARSISIGTNSLASSIVLVCRKQPADATTTTRREFVTALKTELPSALAHLQRGNIAPVDLAQAAIGPGMAIFTRYAMVLDATGKPLSVRDALALINQTLDEALAEQEGDFDADSRWALAWFEQAGFNEGEFGVAETLSKAKNTSISGMVEAGILAAGRGKVRLLRPEELPADWDPAKNKRLTAWEIVHQLIRALESGGEPAAAELAAKLGTKAEIARELAYRLYMLCERKKRATEALSYNGLVQSWPEIARLARESSEPVGRQGGLFE